MATTERNPKANIFPDNSPITTLRNNIVAGNNITASDINSLTNLIMAWKGHYHTYDDAWQLATYGNNGDRGNYYEDKNTGPAVRTITEVFVPPAQVSSGTDITATHHNEMRFFISVVGNHVHRIDDRTS